MIPGWENLVGFIVSSFLAGGIWQSSSSNDSRMGKFGKLHRIIISGWGNLTKFIACNSQLGQFLKLIPFLFILNIPADSTTLK